MNNKALKDLKPGDKVILLHDGAREIRTVSRVTNLAIYIQPRAGGRAMSAYDFDGKADGRFVVGTIAPATPELIQVVQAEIEAKKKARADEKARIEADPKAPYVRRFKNGDWEPWEKLDLDKLKQIATWLDFYFPESR